MQISTCSEWLSTCAGVFRTNIFKSYSFDQNFIKYSWNEYLLLSRQVSLETNQYYLFTSSASYTSIITESGRMSNVPLMYMAESYDLYIFHKLFRTNLVNVIVYLTSRIGRLIFYFLKTIKNKPLNAKAYFACIHSVMYPFLNYNTIKHGNFSQLHGNYINNKRQLSS